MRFSRFIFALFFAVSLTATSQLDAQLFRRSAPRCHSQRQCCPQPRQCCPQPQCCSQPQCCPQPPQCRPQPQYFSGPAIPDIVMMRPPIDCTNWCNMQFPASTCKGCNDLCKLNCNTATGQSYMVSCNFNLTNGVTSACYCDGEDCWITVYAAGSYPCRQTMVFADSRGNGDCQWNSCCPRRRGCSRRAACR